MSNLQLIDDYLANRMTAAEKEAFEKQMAGDPELTQEYEFQKDVVSSIKDARKAELKAMLNEIPVSGGTGSTGLVGKIAATVIVAGVVVGGIYLLNQNEQVSEENTTEQPTIVQEEVDQPGEFIPEETDATEEPSEAPKEIISEESSEGQGVTTKSIGQAEKAPVKEQPVQKPAEINTPKVMDSFETEGEETEIAQPEVYTETEDFSAEKLSTSNIEVITDNSKRKYRFHYQFLNDKLYLYGDFSEGIYEILEFNTSKGKTIYLFFKGNYYLIEKNQEEITSLEPIEDVALKEKLDKLRK